MRMVRDDASGEMAGGWGVGAGAGGEPGGGGESARTEARVEGTLTEYSVWVHSATPVVRSKQVALAHTSER